MNTTSLAVRAFAATVHTFPEPLAEHAAGVVRTAEAGNPDLPNWIERRSARLWLEAFERDAFGEEAKPDVRRLCDALLDLARAVRLEQRVRHGRREPYSHAMRASPLAADVEIEPAAWYVRRPLDAPFALSAAARLAA